MKLNPRTKIKPIKTTNTGSLIVRNPRISNEVDRLYLNGESSEKIAKILESEFSFKTSGQTVRAYLSKCFSVLSAEDEAKFRDIFIKLLESRSSPKQRYIKETTTMFGFLSEVLDKINQETKILSDLQTYSNTTSANAMAIGNMLKLMVDIRCKIEEMLDTFTEPKRVVVYRVYQVMVEFFKKEVFPKLQEQWKNEVKAKLKITLKNLEKELGIVDQTDYKVM